MKYEILYDNFIIISKNKKLYRIRALKDFGDVRKGEIGGYIEHYNNLSQKGTCWVYNEARVYDSAQVYDSVKIYSNARIYGKAQIYGNAQVYGDVRIYGNAQVYGNVHVYGNAHVFGSSRVCDEAKIYSFAYVSYGKIRKDIKDDLINYIACSLNIYPINGKYYLYKRVNKIKNGVYASLYDKNFIYRDGEIAEVKDYDPDFTKACAKGLHVSTPFYWKGGDILIAVEVNVKDVITCMEGKIRSKKLKVIGEIKDEQETTN